MTAPLDSQPAITTNLLCAGYRDRRSTNTVISDASLCLRAGSVTALLGANGAGKSTLIRTISGLQPPLAGEIFFGDRNLRSLSRSDLARLLSVVYTERTHAGALTVSETVALGRQPYTGFFGRLSLHDKEIVARAIDSVGMTPLAGRFLATLSDGERQKVMIARALAQQTPVMLLDEPTSFLDVASRLEVMALLAELARTHNKAILLSTHDVANALDVASRLWLVMPDRSVIDTSVSHALQSDIMNSLFQGRHIYFDPETADFRLNHQFGLK